MELITETIPHTTKIGGEAVEPAGKAWAATVSVHITETDA